MKKGVIITLALAVVLIASCASGGAPADPVSYKVYAADATLETPNGNLQIETGGDAPNVGYWEKLNDVVTWEITVEYSCDYNVTVNYALSDTFTGSVVEVRIGDQVLRWQTAGTGDWSNYTTKDLGNVTLKAGTYPVVMQVVTQCEGDQYDQHYVANVRKITLTTVSD